MALPRGSRIGLGLADINQENSQEEYDDEEDLSSPSRASQFKSNSPQLIFPDIF